VAAGLWLLAVTQKLVLRSLFFVLILRIEAYMGTRIISGILQRLNLDAFMIFSVLETADVGRIFRHLSRNQINIEFVNQISLNNGSSNVILCVDSSKMCSASTELQKLKPLIHVRDIVPLYKVGILSIFPHKEHAFVIHTIIHSLNDAHIHILAMGNSLSSISCVIGEKKVPEAIRQLSKAFDLNNDTPFSTFR
jgi:aspartokinase